MDGWDWLWQGGPAREAPVNPGRPGKGARCLGRPTRTSRHDAQTRTWCSSAAPG